MLSIFLINWYKIEWNLWFTCFTLIFDRSYPRLGMSNMNAIYTILQIILYTPGGKLTNECLVNTNLICFWGYFVRYWDIETHNVYTLKGKRVRIWRIKLNTVYHFRCNMGLPSVKIPLRVMTNLNSLWPNAAIWQHRSVSPLAQLTACHLMILKHFLNQCWIFVSKVQENSSEGSSN